MRRCENADNCKIIECPHEKEHFSNYLDHDNNCEVGCDVAGGIAGSRCREKWLKGRKRQKDIVQMGGTIRCVGCGRILGSTCVVPDGEQKKEPNWWPFSAKDCPVCLNQNRIFTANDVAKLPWSILRKGIIIKKGE